MMNKTDRVRVLSSLISWFFLRPLSSEVLEIGYFVSADGTADRELGSVGRVLDLEGAGLDAGALGQFADLLAGYVVALTLPRMARLAEVGVAPAEPLRDRAAELAFELDEVGAVVLAVGDAEVAAEGLGGALAADEFFWLELLGGLLRRDAVLHAAEVGHFALEALVVRQLEQGPRLQVVIVVIVGILQTGIFVDGFVFSTLNAHGVHLALHFEQLVDLGAQLDVVGLDLDLLLAGGAVEELPGNTR